MEPAYASDASRRLAFLTMVEQHAPQMMSEADAHELERLRAGGSGHSTFSTESIASDGER